MSSAETVSRSTCPSPSERRSKTPPRRRRAEPKNHLQVEVVADHADEVPGDAQAIVRADVPSLRGIVEDLGESGGSPARPLFVEGFHKLRKAIGLGDGQGQ